MKRHHVSPAPHRHGRRPNRTRHFRRLRALAILTGLLQAASFTGYLYLAPRVREVLAEDVNFQLTIAAPGSTDTTPAPTPTPTPSGGGGGGPPRPIPPQQHPDPYVTGEANVAPYIYVGMIDGVPVPFGSPGTTYSYQPAVTGKTNLRDAVVFIAVADDPGRRYTVHANVSGIWDFTVPVPLGFGWHALSMTAVSPINPAVRVDGFFQFQVVPIPPVPPVSEAQPPAEAEPRATPVGPPVPPPLPRLGGVPSTPELYDVRVVVPPSSKVVAPFQPIVVDTTITPLVAPPAGEELAELTYRIRDEQGRTVFEQTRPVFISRPLAYPQTLRQPLNLRPGDYRVDVELRRGSVTFIASDTFQVATPTIALWPGITVPAPLARDMLLRVSLLLGLLLLAFLFLLWLEHRRSLASPPIDERDLRRGGEIR